MLGLASCHRLQAQELIDVALRAERRNAFFDLSFVEPLQRLLRSYEEEADLSLFGRVAARFDILRCLRNLLRLDAAEETDPAIRHRDIAAPLFITGLPRSSTTFQHELLAQDPANAVPRCWELIYPYPFRSKWLKSDPRRHWVEAQLRIFQMMSPDVSDLHPLSADAPQECTDITAQVFQSLRFDTTHNIPSYQAWFDAHGNDEAFYFHKRFLQHLSRQPGRHWTLKSPDHVFALGSIRKVYPDAKIVFLHRDPVSVVASCAKLTEVLRRPFTRALDPKVVGRNVSTRLIQCAERMAEEDKAGNILHLYYRDVVGDPLAAVNEVYTHCGRTLTPAARILMRAWLARRPSGRPRRHYDLAEFGLDAAMLRERFAAYMQYFHVPIESRA